MKPLENNALRLKRLSLGPISPFNERICYMLRYFMNVHRDESAIDSEGALYRDLNAAKDDATGAALELIAEDVLQQRPVIGSHRIEILDEDCRLLDTVFFSDVFTVRDGPIVSKSRF